MESKSEITKELCCSLLSDKQGRDITCLDVRGLTDVADFFILCTGDVDVHIKALADSVVDGMKEQGVKPFHVEGYKEMSWVLIDYTDIIIHIFNEEMRNKYALEQLWGDAVISTVGKEDE